MTWSDDVSIAAFKNYIRQINDAEEIKGHECISRQSLRPVFW